MLILPGPWVFRMHMQKQIVFYGSLLYTIHPTDDGPHIVIANTAPVTLTVKLVNAIFPGAPSGTAIENSGQEGIMILSQSKSIPAAPFDSASSGGIQSIEDVKGQPLNFSFEVATLPRGFYRVYVETSDGKKFWDN